jgi:hypothetical protein
MKKTFRDSWKFDALKIMVSQKPQRSIPPTPRPKFAVSILLVRVNNEKGENEKGENSKSLGFRM